MKTKSSHLITVPAGHRPLLIPSSDCIANGRFFGTNTSPARLVWYGIEFYLEFSFSAVGLPASFALVRHQVDGEIGSRKYNNDKNLRTISGKKEFFMIACRIQLYTCKILSTAAQTRKCKYTYVGTYINVFYEQSCKYFG